MFIPIIFCLLLSFFPLENIHAVGNKDISSSEKNDIVSAELTEELPGQPAITRAEQVMKALAAAYPRQIDQVEFRNNDWAVFLRGHWFYFADGKILREDLIANAASFNRHPFYSYPAELPAWKPPTPEQEERYRNFVKNRTANPPKRSPLFFDDLWRIHDRNEALSRMQTFRLFGKNIIVHYLILEELALVEEHILAAGKKDSKVQKWIDTVDIAETWNWRIIAETQSRSFHSYGLALDFLPKKLEQHSYWVWTTREREDWWNVPYSERYHPPDAVIKAFEKFGFTWGGKWNEYDTMHFEYRPEILILNGISPETRR